MFLHNLLNVLVQIANKMGLQKNNIAERVFVDAVTFFNEPLPSNDRGIFTKPLYINESGIHIHTN
jgi:hypothetical protein